ncbi:MAG TPA: Rieske (2Fe-2S) protein [Solirubrobacteraceae bacterium]|nr:Rieske (2Fe-2S) protein [Solirubrobacteraceae bacterium]
MTRNPVARRPRAHALMDALGSLSALDAPAKAAAKQVRNILKPGTLKDALSGTWLGHTLHPLLTDIPIGSWTSATLLDLFGGEDSRPAARRLIGVGLLAAGPTALAGWSDWADSETGDEQVRRIGIVHASLNGTATMLYGASLLARRRGAHGTGVMLGLAGAGTMAAGGWLGGDMSFARGVGVDQTAFQEGPADWTPALDASMLVDDRPAVATVGDVPVMIVRRNGTLHAIADRCTHRGAPLHEGELVGNCIQCPWHMSRFRLEDGSVERGPAAYPQPKYEAREHDGRIEVRAAS